MRTRTRYGGFLAAVTASALSVAIGLLLTEVLLGDGDCGGRHEPAASPLLMHIAHRVAPPHGGTARSSRPARR